MCYMVGWLFEFYGISTFVGYLMRNPFLYSSEDLPKAMNDREKWRERVRDIRSSGTT